MTNNDILRRIRYIFELSDSKMMKIFSLANKEASRAEICDWLKREDDPSFQTLRDIELSTFLNGFIVDKRGPKEGPTPIPEERITNNLIFLKLKIALNLKAEEVQALLQSAGFTLSKHELSAFFRKPGHKHHRVANDQVLRNFLKGVELKFRPSQGQEDGDDSLQEREPS